MLKSAVSRVQPHQAPITECGTVVPFPAALGSASRVPRREYLTEPEVEQLCDAARKRGRYGHRDATMILICYRHGLRVQELVDLEWADVDLEAGRMKVRRRKGSDDSVQPLTGGEL